MLAGGCADWKEQAEAAVSFLQASLPHHYDDEEASLFPLLRQRCLAEDGLESLLARLHAEHIEGNASARWLAQELSACLAAGRHPCASEVLTHRLKGFVQLERLHLALENAVLIPLARVRLTPGDLDEISSQMRCRRSKSACGLCPSGETPLTKIQ
jgi:hemerythrin-like domain-containing protein